MELKVWVDGLQRVVCGLAERTTCQEVIYALAHATGKTGRFVLVEKWRTSERSLSPHDRPLELLSKWGEYASDVQFVLRCLESSTNSASTTHQQQRPSAVIQQQQRPKLNGLVENHVNNRPPHNHRRMNSSVEENGCVNKAQISTDSMSTQGPQRNAGNTVGGVASSTMNNKERVVGLQSSTTTTTGSTSAVGVLKPYFVDTSNPTPESGTLLRPTSAIAPITSAVQQPTPGYEAAQEKNTVRRTNTLSPTPTSSQENQYTSTTSNGQVQRGMASTIDSRRFQQQPTNGASLTVLSQSAHESLNSQAASCTPSNATSFDSTGTTVFLEMSYSSSSNAQAKQMDLSQTSFCSSSMSSTTSNGPYQGQQQSRMNGSRPPPPSYNLFVMRKNREHQFMSNRSHQSSPAPVFGQGNVPNCVNRSRTPVSIDQQQRPSGPSTRDQLIKMIENQQLQLQAQHQKMHSYDVEIALRENSENQPTPAMDHLRRELQQLEVERVHVKQKVEELRRQDLDGQLVTLRQTLAETLTESSKMNEKLRSLDTQLAMNEEKIRHLGNDLEREKSEILNLTASTSFGSLNDALLASNDAFEARMKKLEEMLKEKRRQLEGATITDQSIKNPRSKSFDSSVHQHSAVKLLGNQKQLENTSGVWV